jgi:predicted DNA binding protein
MAELKSRSATDVSYFFKVLERDPYLLDYKIVKRRSSQVTLLITRKQMGTFRALYATDPFLSGPIVIRKGVRYYPIVAPAKKIKQLVKLIIENAPVKTEIWFSTDNPAASSGSFHNTFITAQDIVSELSYMELKALITAFQLGYFSKPRLQDSRKISKQLGISHPTFSEHLRNAEKKSLG